MLPADSACVSQAEHDSERDLSSFFPTREVQEESTILRMLVVFIYVVEFCHGLIQRLVVSLVSHRETF